MRSSFKMALTLLILALGAALWADNPAGVIKLENFDLPLATTDNLFSPLINPSLLGTGRPSGLGWAHLNDEEKWQDHYWFSANLEGLSYVLEHDNGADYHTFATGTEFFARNVFPNLYAGTSYGWRNNKAGEGHFRSAISYRPHDAASLAFRWDNPYKAAPAYHAGIGLRPLALIMPRHDYRLELTADLDYAKDATGDYKMFKPSIGINTQILDGILMGASYNLETESTFLNFSLRKGSSELGATMRQHENDNYGVAYLHLGEQTFKPFLGINSPGWYNMPLKGEVVAYRAPKYTLGPITVFDSEQRSIESLIEDIQIAKANPAIKGIALVNPSFSASFALQQELYNAMLDFKEDGRKIAFYFDNISNGGYIFASSLADKIYLNPMGSLDLKGISISSPYLHGMLESLGIEVMNFRSHPFKTAGNTFSESEMSPAEREMYESFLGSIYDQMIDQVNRGRGDKLDGNLRDIIDQGPYYLASDALDKGLVDGLVYQDEFYKTLKEEFGFSRNSTSNPEYSDYSWAHPKTTKIAVIYTQGNIVMGEGTPGQKIAHATTVRQIRAARQNKEYKGIILRVDSGGGSAQASDIILRELELAQSENKLPVVVSMAGVAASGGYYISCGADRIIADPATLTGSIGVIGLTFNAQRAFQKIRVNWSTVKTAERSDFGSIYRPWTQGEKDLMSRMIEHTYDDFTRKVDTGRETMNLDQVLANAQGRVWTGAQAHQIGLVDDLGGMDKALEHMRELTGITGEIELIDTTTNQKGFVVNMKGNPLSMLAPVAALEEMGRDYIQIYEMWKDFDGDNVLMLSPLETQMHQF